MSKLYTKYLELKKKEDVCYLFKVGVFYLLLEEDAKKCSEIFHLKLTHLNDDVLKCGFPVGSLEKYLPLFKEKDIQIKIIDKEEILDNGEYLKNNKIMKILEKIKKEDINKINGLKALMLIDELKELL